MDFKKKIMVVDDVAINLSVIENTLRAEYDVITVNSGTRALKYLQRDKPDLILLDIRMEHKDGIQTLREIRQMPGRADIPVIMLTSAHDRNSVIESTKLGIYDYVLKPFDAKDLRSRIRRALNLAAGITEDAEEE